MQIFSSEVSVQLFSRRRVWLYGILFISDPGWVEVWKISSICWFATVRTVVSNLCCFLFLCTIPSKKSILVLEIEVNCRMAFIRLLNEFLKLYYNFILKKDYIINKSVGKVWKWIYVWINVCFFKLFHGNVRVIWSTYCSHSMFYFL